MKPKILLTVILTIAGCLLLSGCSSKPVAEMDLMSYIVEDDPLSNCFMVDHSYSDLSVEKRMTDKDAKSDRVWVTFTAQSETDRAEVSACMNFTLYNDGWLLDDIEVLNTKFVPLCGPDRQIFTDFLGSQYDYFQYQSEEVNLDNGTAIFYYKTLTEHNYMHCATTLAIECIYDRNGSIPGWFYTYTTPIEVIEDWHRVFGTWETVEDYTGLMGPNLKDVYTLNIGFTNGDWFEGSWSEANYYKNNVYEDKLYGDTIQLNVEQETTRYGAVIFEVEAGEETYIISSRDGVEMSGWYGEFKYTPSDEVKEAIDNYSPTLFEEYFDLSEDVERGYRD